MQAVLNLTWTGHSKAVVHGLEVALVDSRTDPRIVRTTQACGEAIVELASEQPISQITVADLADRAQDDQSHVL